MFWGRNIFTVIVPFTLLLFLNTRTISNLNRTSKHIDSMLVEFYRMGAYTQIPSLITTNNGASMARRRKRDATRTVSVYLIANSLNMIITIMEFFDQASLMEMGGGWTYEYLADLSSLLTISSTASRLPVYFHCNRELRTQIRQSFSGCNQKIIAENV